MNKNFVTTAKVTLAVVCFMPTIAIAQDNNAAELQRLKDRLSALEAKIAKENSSNVITSLQGGPHFKTSDGKYNFAIDGRMQIDAASAVKDKTNSMNSDIALRRLWLGISGDVEKDWGYRLLVGFENNQTSVYDTFIRYHGFKNADIMIGNFFENNGLDIQQGNLVTPLMERASGITTFRQFRRTGVNANYCGENYGAHFGVFGSNPSNSTTSAVNANNKGVGASGRIHAAFINDKKNSEFLHLGFNSTYRRLSSGTNSVTGSNQTMRFTSASDSSVVNVVLIDTGNITNVNNYYQNMGEFRYQNGSLTLTSEFIRTTLNRSGFQNVNFNGGYAMASYFLTGEKYGYDSKTGLQTAAEIGNKGAWEIAARYSMTDLKSKTINGGKLNSYDFGVNYYPNNHLKFMMNYVYNQTNSAAQVQKNPQYLMFRAQLSF